LSTPARVEPTVRLSFTPDPAYVRTVRMVAAAAARQAGVADDLLDEVRLAIGEACTRAIGVHRRHGLPDPVDVSMSDGGRFTVRVIDRGSADEARREREGSVGDLARTVDAQEDRDGLDEDTLPPELGLALLGGLVHDLSVVAAPGGSGTEVRMSWPVVRRKGSRG
jgi:anti-sigma regulatory factor (Ser/Thr protein kinase)